MSSNGGPRNGSDEPTSFGLQPPNPPVAVPHPGNPYAAPTQVVPPQSSPSPQSAFPTPSPSPSAPPPGSEESPTREPGAGRLIAGRYRLIAKLGHGGMGTVWRAKDETVDREVAVKEPRVPDHLPGRERDNAFERMRREARAAARLDHPAVVNVHDVAVVDDQPWIVMELVRGRTLGDALQEGTLDAREAARVGLEVLGALDAAHAAGILHRDVKPDNVLLGRHDRVVLTDFGIAQIEGETNLTDTGGFVGSPEYIAPERVLGQRPGPASDLWSLGVVLYAATEGVSPFRRSNTPATLQSVLNAAPAPPASARGPLAEVITGLLDKDPARRPDAARVRALLDAAANPPAPAPTQVVRVAEGHGPAGPGSRWSVRLGRNAWITLGALVVAAAVASYLVVAAPFAGPLPEGWKRHELPDKAGMSVAVPADFVKPKKHADDWDGTNETFTDPSGMVVVHVDRDIKADDEDGDFPATASAHAWADWDKLKDGDYARDIADAPAPKGEPVETEYKGDKAAENTVEYTTTDSQNPRDREYHVLYYTAGNGDNYRVSIDYPGSGYFVDEGREIARTVVANWEVGNS
ncbi:serine/threonine-protein kinase [Streptomyces sp. DH41]|uniref:serine/threonine-protein kinase n=1 Tax=Streptomyces sp. DH41 TaxID=3040125 RepID=UPI002441C7F4|nr:serine/threonine-protein kinase [Streptomyces sp. DH41]MDG9722365.1 serine/threonine-protein kinase [Streptomyces sp. DH41]